MAKAAMVIAYPGRTRQRLETRDRIFAAALTEFHRVGFAAAQIEEIVRRAEVARGTFYLHFPTKDHVLMELMRRRQQRLAQRLNAVRSTDVRAVLRRAAALMLDDARGEDTALWHEMFAVLGRHASELRSENNPLVEALTAVFSAAQQRGAIRPDVTPFELTSVLLPGMLGLLQMRLTAPPAELRQSMYRIVDVFVRGIQA